MSMIFNSNHFSDVIIQSSFDAILSTSLDSVITSWNPTAEKLYGYTAIEAIGQPISIITPSHKQSELSKIMEKIKCGEQIEHFETTHQHKNGSLIDVSITIAPIKDANSNLIGFFTIAHAISEREYFEERFRQTLDALLDAIIAVDTTGKIIFANAKINGIFGYTQEDVLGKSVEMLIPEPYHSRHRAHRQQYFLQPRARPMGSRSMELYGLHKNGREIPLEINLSPLKTKDSILALAAIRDISEKKRNENALKEKTKKLEYANQALEEFTDITSHDLKEPLRGIHHFSHFLLEDYGNRLDEVGKEKLRTVKNLSQRMQTLIDTLLIYSRISQSELTLSPVDIGKVIQDKLQLLHSFLQKNQAKILILKPMPSIICDRTCIGEVFQNLMTNAVKYNDHEQKRVEIDYKENKDEVIFSVKDNGMGISKEQYEQVFKIFKRLHARNEYGGGTGAGLSIVKRIIERHQGKIWIESAVGQGTTIYFSIKKGVTT